MYKRHLNQISLLEEPEYFGGIALDKENEWVKLAKLIPWHEFEEEYAAQFSSKTGQPACDVQMALGSLLIKERYQFSDEETVAHITMNHTDNSNATVTSGFTCSPTKLGKAGTKKITVKYKGKTTSFNVTVSKVVKSIKIKSKPSKLKYKTGETLNTNGLKLTVTYTDKSTKTISSGFTCTPTAFTKVGTQKITVKYGGKSASFNVTVSKGKTTSNTLPKLTKDNVAKELEKQIRWYAAYQNGFRWQSFKKTGGNVAFTDSNDVEYYRVYDFNSIKEVQNELSKYMIVPTNCVKQISVLKEKSGKLYANEFYGGGLVCDLKSVSLKEFKNNAYYVYVNVSEVPDYYTKDLLKIVEKDGYYKIESFVQGKTAYDVPHDIDSHPERYHLVIGLGD